MEITRTINSNRRYYIDEGCVFNAASLIDTINKFNNAVMYLYNVTYDKQFEGKGPLTQQNPVTKKNITYPSLLKEKYGTNDYYNAAINSVASAQVSSQCGLRQYYQKTTAADIKTRQNKIAELEESLKNKQSIKNSLRTHAKTGKWVKPYPKCTIKLQGSNIVFRNKEKMPVDEYERAVESDIRTLKTKIKLVKEACKRKERRLANLDRSPQRIIFGTKELYAEKDKPEIAGSATAKKQWKEKFFEARHCEMTLPGRHTSKHGNFLCQYKDGSLTVKCMDGKEAIFTKFALPRYQEEFMSNFSSSPKDRQSVCYNFSLKRDKKGRQYILVSVTMNIRSAVPAVYDNGAVSMDINYDHFALSDIDKGGNLLENKLIRFNLVGKTSGQNTDILGRAIKKVFDWCELKHKCLIVEDIDLTIKLASRKYGSRRGNHHMTLFAYRKILSSIENQALRRGIGFKKINPAYTSQMGKFLFMRKYGISIHMAASYTIGLVGLELLDKLKPDQRLCVFVADKDKNPIQYVGTNYILFWHKIAKAFKKVPKHFFYREIPYDILQKKTRPSLRTLSNEMITRYAS